jgi:hypothetical protein
MQPNSTDDGPGSDHAARRSPSTWRNHRSSWFQLAKFRLTINRSCLFRHLQSRKRSLANGNRTAP